MAQKQAINWSHIDPALCRHMASLDKELTCGSLLTNKGIGKLGQHWYKEWLGA